MSDPFYNDPAPVTVAGREWVCRELPYPEARKFVRFFFDIIRKLQAIDPTLDLANAESLKAYLMANAVELIERAGDSFRELVILSTGATAEDVDRLPLSAFLDLSGHVLEAQAPVVRAFLALRDRAGMLVSEAGATNGSRKPKSQPSSPAEVSVGTPSGG